jgi:hypothetical protein
MPDTPAPAALEAEFDCLMARAKIVIPVERRAAILAGFDDFRGQIALLHGPRTAAAEPSNIFSLKPMAGV